MLTFPETDGNRPVPSPAATEISPPGERTAIEDHLLRWVVVYVLGAALLVVAAVAAYQTYRAGRALARIEALAEERDVTRREQIKARAERETADSDAAERGRLRLGESLMRQPSHAARPDAGEELSQLRQRLLAAETELSQLASRLQQADEARQAAERAALAAIDALREEQAAKETMAAALTEARSALAAAQSAAEAAARAARDAANVSGPTDPAAPSAPQSSITEPTRGVSDGSNTSRAKRDAISKPQRSPRKPAPQAAESPVWLPN
jgi:hypothetical protein